MGSRAFSAISEAQRQQLSRFLEPRDVPRMRRKQETGEDLLNDRADRLEGHSRFAIDPLLLQKGIRDGGSSWMLPYCSNMTSYELAEDSTPAKRGIPRTTGNAVRQVRHSSVPAVGSGGTCS